MLFLALGLPLPAPSGHLAFAQHREKKRMEKLEEMRAAEECPRLPRSYAECWEYVRSDYYRYTGRRASLPAMWLYAWRNPAFGFSLWLRLSAWSMASCAVMCLRFL